MAATGNRLPRLSSDDDDAKTFDVVIVGAGIIGLTIARQFLMDSELSVAIVDKSVPCSGATGAGTPLYAFLHIIIFSVASCEVFQWFQFSF